MHKRYGSFGRYYEITADLIRTGLFSGLAHPDSIKCFHHYPSYDMMETYFKIAALLNEKDMWAEQSGGLALNYGFHEIGMGSNMLKAFKRSGVKILTASDAHRPEHAGANIARLQKLVDEA